ncbi:MAG TPA: septal ring lytic transglycosylase RlpA family protein [Thermoanaerobaculia bacterium]|jgi:rare lipoprotein A
MKPRLTWLAVLLFAAYGCVTTKSATKVPQTELLQGVASWYGEEFAGRTTANGEIFDPLLLTAAHRELPFGTIVDVKNAKSGETVRVRINDRGPYVGNRMIDLSYAAAQQIGLIEPGIGDVEVRIVKVGAGDREPPAPYEVGAKAPPPAVAAVPPSIPVVAPPATAVPAVEFPLPSETTTAAAPAVVDRVEVIEERGGVATRRQVSADGRTLEAVPADETTARPAEAIDRERIAAPAPRVTRKSGQFFVQVGAFSVEANAKALRDRLAEIGQKAWIDREALYRVRLGPFASREQAATARGALEASGVSAIIVAE